MRPMPPKSLSFNTVSHFNDHNVAYRKLILFDPVKTRLKGVVHPIPVIRTRSWSKEIYMFTYATNTTTTVPQVKKQEIKRRIPIIDATLLILRNLARYFTK